MKLKQQADIKVDDVTKKLCFYLFKKLKEKSNWKGELPISRATEVISISLRIPKTGFRAQKKGVPLSAYDFLKLMEKLGLLKIFCYNKVLLCGENENGKI